MRNRSPLGSALLFVALIAICATRLLAAVPNRISGAVNQSATVALSGHIHPQVKRAVDNGRLNGAITLPALSLNFAPSEAQKATLDALLTAQQDPSSASYHQWLTPTQFGAQFGMSDADLTKVTAWLQSRGFTVDRVAPSRNAIHFSGTVDQVEQTFHTELHSLSVNGETHFANITEPLLPAAFAGTVAGIRGLDNFRPKPHLRANSRLVSYVGAASKGSANSSAFPFAVGSQGTEYVTPEDFANIYDVKALYNAGFSGSATYPIGIIGRSAVRSADISDFRSAFGLNSTLPTNVLVPGTGTSAINSIDDLSESELDLEEAGGVAPNAPLYFIYTGNAGCTSNSGCTYDVFDALQYAIQGYTVNSKPIPILSLSYGSCEFYETPANFTMNEGWFKQANAQGQTILSASGDQGAADCDYSTTAVDSYSAVQGLAVDYPSGSVYVTSVGGTSFSGDVNSTAAYWSTTEDTYYGNELGLFIPSTAWNNTPTTALATKYTGLSAGGGGVSALSPKPSWQTGVPGIPADGKRDVPDVSLNADPAHDATLFCINLHCEGQNLSSGESGNNFDAYGGTSVAAPGFAGILALIEQKLGSSLGNVNPALYTLAANATSYASAFHDVTTGSNIVPCLVNGTVVGTGSSATTITGDTGCVGGSMGYNAGTGYDLVTGLGAPDALNLSNVLANVATLIATTDTLTYTPTNIVTGQTVIFTATITHTTGTAAPTGSVLFTVDGASSGTTVVLGSSGIATFSTAFTVGGSHTVSAVYSGDSTYNGSASTAAVTVASSGIAATATTLTVSPTTIPVGSVLTLTANVTSVTAGTIGGQVTFKTSAGATLGIGNLSSGTATLTITVATASLPIGTDTITASYAGDANFSPSTSSSASITVTNPTITLAATNISVASGGNGSSTITITSGGNYAGTVNLTASTTSTLSGQYSFTPASVTLAAGGTGTSTFTLTGITASAKAGSGGLSLRSGLASLVLGGGLSFAGLLLFGSTGIRRKRLASLLSVLAFTALAAGLGCGSSSSSTSTTTTTTTTGTYTVTITGTDSNNNVTGSTTLTVTIH